MKYSACKGAGRTKSTYLSVQYEWRRRRRFCVCAGHIQFARTMTWKGKHPLVELVTTTYQTGIKSTKEANKAKSTNVN
jgi:hypothetical protein